MSRLFAQSGSIPGERSTAFRYVRLLTAAAFLMAVVLVGTVGYLFLGHGIWEFGDCFYMTLITISTVGYGETLPGMDRVWGARVWTGCLILIGSGTLIYFASMLTAVIVEGDLQGALRRSRMQKQIDRLSDHFIVCGVGDTGIHIVEELVATLQPFVVVDTDGNRLNEVAEELGPELLYIIGDATDDKVMQKAGIDRARGLIATLHDDRDNLFLAVTARALSDDLRIVAKAVDPDSAQKFKRVGTNAVVSPNFIGGMRMVSELIRPTVVEFLDVMLRDRELNMRIEEVSIPEGSNLVGEPVGRIDLERAGNVLLMAIRTRKGEYIYNPDEDQKVVGGQDLVVMARAAEVKRLREGLQSGNIGLKG